MIVFSGADLVLPDRILTAGTLVVDGERITDIRPGTVAKSGDPSPHPSFVYHDHYIVPGFVDVHVHGIAGLDVLGSNDAVGTIAATLPRYGVTAFCPTTVACEPSALRRTLEQVRRLRELPPARAARVLPAHLESNFINAEYRGAQPSACLRMPREAFQSRRGPSPREFTGRDILDEIERAAPDVGIVTLASELDAGLELVRLLASRGHRVSLGHSGATYDEALAAIGEGARQATHLFNRMPPFGHREPGLVGAILQSDDVAAELICDGFHVHPAAVRAAVAAKRPSRILAVSDGTAASGLPPGSRTQLGDQVITAGESAAHLDDGTLAGSVATMDHVLRTLVGPVALSLVDAVTLCSTTPARELGLVGHGVLAVDAAADFVVLDSRFRVVQTYVAGQLAYARPDVS